LIEKELYIFYNASNDIVRMSEKTTLTNK